MLAQPTPMRPWRTSPVRAATTTATSSGSRRRSRSASAATLAERLAVAETALEVVTTSQSSTPHS